MAEKGLKSNVVGLFGGTMLGISSVAPAYTLTITLGFLAVTVGAKALWLQEGIVSEDAAARAKAGGLTVVMNVCIGATHSLLRVPKKTLG